MSRECSGPNVKSEDFAVVGMSVVLCNTCDRVVDFNADGGVGGQLAGLMNTRTESTEQTSLQDAPTATEPKQPSLFLILNLSFS